MKPLTLLRLPGEVPAAATFQSHNQKVLQTREGIFLCVMTRQDAPDTGRDSCQWRILRSTDGGDSFDLAYESPILGGNKPACLEADEDGNLLAFCENARDVPNEMLFLKFQGFRNPRFLKVGPSHYGKFSMAYDRATRTVHAWNHYGRLFWIDPDRGVRRWMDVVQNGPHATLQYPHVFLEPGRLHHAWTTQAPRHRWDIHYIQSRTGGEAWQKADGTPLALPIVGDDTGPADAIVLPDELEQETWLANLLVKEDKAHFAYLAYRSSVLPESTPFMNRQHYVRLDLATGRIDRNLYPEWKGERVSLNGQDGFFATRPGAPLVHVGRANHTSIGALASRDNGETWEDLALSESLGGSVLYAIGGCREITEDGFVLGTFTDCNGPRPEVCFFKIPVS
jgi:hypothetical protein